MGEIFHVYNRTNAKEPALKSFIFQERFLTICNFYRFPQKIKYSTFKELSTQSRKEYEAAYLNKSSLVRLIVFALMPNHYHFLLKAESYSDISEFISKVQNSFAKYYNLMQDRDGSLFQRQYKSRRITSNEDFFLISKYIHLNPVEAGLLSFDQLSSHYSTSLRFYKNISLKQSDMIETKLILDIFGSFERYLTFLHPSGGEKS